jgi:vancomycin resistance protein YoaR
VELTPKKITPSVLLENVKKNYTRRGEAVTDIRYDEDRNKNIELAFEYINSNGSILKPGETFSFNDVVGRRTQERGFYPAIEYVYGEKETGFGGGVCQASTTLYNAVIMANMTILERHSHNMTVSYVEPSQDAAVEYGVDGKDFVFRNDTDHAIYIYTNVDKENATVTIYGTRPEYHYELKSVVVEEKKSERKRYENDMSGKYVYYITDKPVLKTKGHGSCRSEGWLVAYDWDTKEEVSREQISYDSYVAGMNVYWRGVHDEKGNVVEPEAGKEEKGT